MLEPSARNGGGNQQPEFFGRSSNGSETHDLTRTVKVRDTKKYKRRVSMDITKQNYDELKRNNLTRVEIAEIFNIPEWKLKKIITAEGWGRTPPKVVNELCFSEFNEHSCYWGGFIAADGCITAKSETLKICLHHKDLDHLKKFKAFVGSTHAISENTDKYLRCEIGFKNTQVNRDLMNNFNITPNKSLTYQMPKIPELYMRHFLRGYFDGDGCISESFSNKNSRTSTLYTTITGSGTFIKSLNKYLLSKNIAGTEQYKNNGIMVLKYNTNQSKMLLTYMYGNSSVSLDRKYFLYNNIVLLGNRKSR